MAVRLKRSRMRAGMTQNSVASMLSLSCGVISDYENGRRTPSVNILRKMADMYHVSSDYLLGIRTADGPIIHWDKLNKEQTEAIVKLVRSLETGNQVK